MLYFTAEHEWLLVEGDIATVGITNHAQEALGDVVYVELPKIGQHYAQQSIAGVVESVKAASDVYMPVDGEILAINDELVADTTLANRDPQGAGWFFKIRLTSLEQLTQLLNETAYNSLTQA